MSRISISQAKAVYEPLEFDAAKRNGQRDLVDAISAAVDVQRRTAQRKNAKQEIIAPTPERLAKGGLVDPVERYKHALRPELENAARQLRNDFLLAETGPRVTANLTGNGGGVPGPRHGGVADHVREAQATVSLIRAEFPAPFVQAIEWFVTQVVTKSNGAAMKFEDMGRDIVPWKSEDAQKGSGYTRLVDALELAALFYRMQNAYKRPEDERAMLQAVRARAQMMRERKTRQLR